MMSFDRIDINKYPIDDLRNEIAEAFNKTDITEFLYHENLERLLDSMITFSMENPDIIVQVKNKKRSVSSSLKILMEGILDSHDWSEFYEEFYWSCQVLGIRCLDNDRILNPINH